MAERVESDGRVKLGDGVYVTVDAAGEPVEVAWLEYGPGTGDRQEVEWLLGQRWPGARIGEIVASGMGRERAKVER